MRALFNNFSLRENFDCLIDDSQINYRNLRI